MAKVLLALCNSPMDNLIPLGTSLLSACLKQAGHDVRLFDTTFYRTRERTGDDDRVETLQVKATNLADFGIEYKKAEAEDDFSRAIQEFNPDLIGMSAVEITYPIAKRLLDSVRDVRVPKIVGGVQATLARDELIGEDCLDGICVGEGEGMIVELADRISRGQDYSDVRNLWLRSAEGIRRNPLRALVNLDELPFQDWSLYEQKRFFKPMGGKVWVMGNVELARSCMHRCTYCANDALHQIYAGEGLGRYYREKSISRAIAEAVHLKREHGLQYLYFIAENFLATSSRRLEEFFSSYGEVGVPFYIDTRPETLTPERVRALESVRCEGIAMGIESGDSEFRRRMLNRNMENETIVRAARAVRENSNIRLSVNNIIGFPTETREGVFRTIELNRQIPAHSFMVNVFSPYHGTVLREVSIQRGYITRDSAAGDYRGDYVLDMPQLTREELRGLRRTFPLYVKFPKERWSEIERAERFDEEGDRVFQELSQEYREKFM